MRIHIPKPIIHISKAPTAAISVSLAVPVLLTAIKIDVSRFLTVGMGHSSAKPQLLSSKPAYCGRSGYSCCSPHFDLWCSAVPCLPLALYREFPPKWTGIPYRSENCMQIVLCSLSFVRHHFRISHFRTFPKWQFR